MDSLFRFIVTNRARGKLESEASAATIHRTAVLRQLLVAICGTSLLAACAVASILDRAQQGIVIRGVVVDSRTRKPIQGATANAIGSQARAPDRTDRNGRFDIELAPGIKPGDLIRLRVEMEGYKRYDEKVVASDSDLLQVALEPADGQSRSKLPPPFKHDEIGILIAEVRGDNRHETQVAYQTAIRQLVLQRPNLQNVVKVRLLNRELPIDLEGEHAEALAIGRQLRAAFVLRPHQTGANQEPWLTVVNQTYLSKPEALLRPFPTDQLVEFEKLRLPEDLALLAKCALGAAFGNQKSFGKAAEEFRSVLNSPAATDISPWLADIHLALATSLWLDQSHLYDEVLDHVNKAISIDPDLAPAHNALGVLLARDHRDEGALREFETAVRVGQWPNNIVVAHMNIGAMWEGDHKYAAAVDEYLKAVAVDPQNAGPHGRLCHRYFSDGRYEDALPECNRAIGLAPNYSYSYTDRCLVRQHLGKPGAVEDCRKVVEMEPQSPQARVDLCYVYHERRRFDEAIRECREAIALGPDRPEAHINLGILYYETHRLRDAVPEYERAVAMAPANPEYITACANVLIEAGQYDRAAGVYLDAIKIGAPVPEIHFKRGFALTLARRFDDAVIEYKVEIMINPGNARAAGSNLCGVLVSAAKYAEAADTCRRVVALYPEDEASHQNLLRAGQGLASEAPPPKP